MRVNWTQECAAVIPCLNEAATIREVVSSVLNQLPMVLVVDDGSTDATAKQATAAGAQLVRHEQSQGKGAALTTGWRRAANLGFTWSLCLDGDGQHDAADIPRFLRCADETGALLVVGNRFHQPVKMPWVRRRVNAWMSERLSRLAGQRLPDSQCGFRLMRLDAWSELPLITRHYEFESEILLAFAAAGHRIEFVPVRAIYGGETSKINPLRDTWRWFRWLKRRHPGRVGP